MVNTNTEVDLKTFNQAKLYAEKILFKMMEDYQKYMRQSDFGADNLDDASNYSEEIRNIKRFNGLKGSADVIYNLINTIRSTILLHNNKEEIDTMNETIDTIEKLKLIFSDSKSRFFEETYKNNRRIEILNTIYFEKIKKIITACYSRIEMLMTRNKLLFSDSKDEFASDAEIMEEIKNEYAGE